MVDPRDALPAPRLLRRHDSPANRGIISSHIGAIIVGSATRGTGADMGQDLTLSIDVGPGSGRAARVDEAGEILPIASREHDQIVPRFGWAEQRPQDWWSGVVEAIRATL